MKDWIDGYSKVPVRQCVDYYVGRPWKIVLHTTESPAGTMRTINNLFLSKPCSSPHFCIDPATGERVQYLPLGKPAAALQGGRGGYETNRANCIQVEIIGYANQSSSLSDDALKFIAQFIVDVINAGVDINLDHVPYFPGPKDGTVAVENSRFRFSPSQFEMFDSVCGHVHVPFNSHYDPYNINIDRIMFHVKNILNPQPKEENLMVTQEDETKIRNIVREEINSALSVLGRWENDTRDYLKEPVIKFDDMPHQFIILSTGAGVAKQWIQNQEQRAAFVNAGLIPSTPPRVISDPEQKTAIMELPTVGPVPADW